MEQITPHEILDYRKKPDSYLLVYANLTGCNGCEMFKPVVESMKKVFPEIEFRSLTINSLEEVPVFLSATFPSINFFYEGMRIREFLGLADSREHLKEVIKSWVL